MKTEIWVYEIWLIENPGLPRNQNFFIKVNLLHLKKTKPRTLLWLYRVFQPFEASKSVKGFMGYDRTYKQILLLYVMMNNSKISSGWEVCSEYVVLTRFKEEMRSEMEFKEFEPRFKSAKTQLNLAPA